MKRSEEERRRTHRLANEELEYGDGSGTAQILLTPRLTGNAATPSRGTRTYIWCLAAALQMHLVTLVARMRSRDTRNAKIGFAESTRGSTAVLDLRRHTTDYRLTSTHFPVNDSSLSTIPLIM